MFCRYCGTQNADEARFCKHCGKQLHSEEAKIQSPKPQVTPVAVQQTAQVPQPTPKPQPMPAQQAAPASQPTPKSQPVPAQQVAPAQQAAPIPQPTPKSQPVQAAPQQQPASKKQSKVWLFILIGALVIAAAAAGVLIYLRSTRKIDLNAYVVIDFSGVDGYGNADIFLDWDEISSDYGDSLCYVPEKEIDILGMLGISDKGSISAEILRSGVEVSIEGPDGRTPHSNLSNGDVVSYSIDVDRDIADCFNYDILAASGECEVTGLSKIEEVDAFAQVELKLSGVEPFGEVTIIYKGADFADSDFSLSKSYDLSNGDVVTVTFDADRIDYYARENGKVPAETEKQYTINGLDEYVSKSTDIEGEQASGALKKYIEAEKKNAESTDQVIIQNNDIKAEEKQAEKKEEKKPVKNGWVKEGNTYYYYKNGTMVTGWIQDGGKWYYCDANGKMVANAWRTVSGADYYFGSDGAMLANAITPDGYKVGSDGKRIIEAETSNSSDNSGSSGNYGVIAGTYKYDDGNEYWEDEETGEIGYHYKVTLNMGTDGKYSLTVNNGKTKTKYSGTYKYNPDDNEELIKFRGNGLGSEGYTDANGSIEVYVTEIGEDIWFDR